MAIIINIDVMMAKRKISAGELAELWRTRGFRDFRAALAGPWPDLPCAGCSKRFEKIW